jgi:ribosomal protein S18 acetylase RimI-like enzyme
MSHIRFDSRNDRSKGTITEIATDARRLQALLAEEAFEAEYGTRFAARVMVAKGVDPNVERLYWRGWTVSLEAFVLVRGHPRVAGVAYYGANDCRRLPGDQIRHQERLLYADVMERPYRPLPEMRPDILSAPRLRTGDLETLAELYRSSYASYPEDFGETAVREMIESGMTVVARTGQHEIVAVCIAQIEDVPVEKSLPLRLVEITHEATHPAWRDRGIGSAVKLYAIERLRSSGDPIPTVITSEARANSARALRSNLKVGMSYAGYLPGHAAIRSPSDEAVPQEGKFGNLVLFYVP